MLTVFNTSVAVYSNDLTKTKNMTLKDAKTLKNKKKTLKKFFKNIKHVFTFIKKTLKNVFYICDVL